MLQHRRVCEGCLIDSHLVFPLSFEMKLAFSREEESQCPDPALAVFRIAARAYGPRLPVDIRAPQYGAF